MPPKDPKGLAHAIRQALLTPPAFTDPGRDPLTQALSQTEARLLQRLSGTTPAATTIIEGRPLCEATVGQPTKHDFCPRCEVDLFTNPETRVLRNPSIGDLDMLEVQCDCGTVSLVPRWLFL